MHPERLNCIRFARDRRDFVFALHVDDRPGIFMLKKKNKARERKIDVVIIDRHNNV